MCFSFPVLVLSIYVRDYEIKAMVIHFHESWNYLLRRYFVNVKQASLETNSSIDICECLNYNSHFLVFFHHHSQWRKTIYAYLSHKNAKYINSFEEKCDVHLLKTCVQQTNKAFCVPHSYKDSIYPLFWNGRIIHVCISMPNIFLLTDSLICFIFERTSGDSLWFSGFSVANTNFRFSVIFSIAPFYDLLRKRRLISLKLTREGIRIANSCNKNVKKGIRIAKIFNRIGTERD